MSAQDLGPYFSSAELAAELNKNHIPCKARTPLEWSRRYAGISIKIGSRRLFPQRVARLLLDGVQFRDIPAMLGQPERRGVECVSRGGRPSVRRQAGGRGARRPG